jgi:hypothetical protein
MSEKNMYEMLPKLEDSKIDQLKELRSVVPFNNQKIRLGAGGADRRSVFYRSKWYDWTKAQMNQFKSCFESSMIEQSVIGWFMHLPKDLGFMDVMNRWVDSPMAGVVVGYALEDGMEVWINGQCIPVPKGQGIRFSLKHLHEMKNKNFDQNWACLMQLG